MDTPSPPQRSWLARLFLTAPERRLRAGWRLLGHISLMLALYACVLFPLAAWMYITGESTPTLLSGQVSAVFAITLSVFIARRLLDRRSFISLGLALNRTSLLDLVAGFFIAGLMMGIIFSLEWAAGWLKVQAFAWEGSPPSEVFLGVAGMLAAFILVGWQEELLSRGYWLQNLSEGTNLFWGLLISSTLFALGHLGNPHVSLNAIIGLVLAGLFLAFGYLRTRQLWLPIGLHIGWNFFEGSVFGFQVSGLENLPRLVLQSVEGPVLLTGGLFGPEAGLVLLPGLGLGIALIVWYTKSRRERGL